MAESSDRNGAGGRLTGAEAAELSRQIAGLTGAGLPLASGLVALGEELPRGRLRRSMNDLARTLESGVPLEKAVKAKHDQIPPHFRGLVIAGVRSGDLGAILSRFTQYTTVGAELKRALWISLAYPILTVAFATASVPAGVHSARRPVRGGLPGLQHTAPVIDDRAIVPRPRCQFDLRAAGRDRRVGLRLVAVRRTFLTPAVRRSFASRLPLLGTVWRSTSLAEFCHLLALLLESRLPLPEAIRLTGEGVQDADIDRACAPCGSPGRGGPLAVPGDGEPPPVPEGTRTALALGREPAHPARGAAPGRRHVRGPRSIALDVRRCRPERPVHVACAVHARYRAGALAPLITLISRLSG